MDKSANDWQGVNVLTHDGVTIVAEAQEACLQDDPADEPAEDSAATVPPAERITELFQSSDSDPSDSYGTGTDWSARIAEHDAEVESYKEGMDRALETARAEAAASERARIEAASAAAASERARLDAATRLSDAAAAFDAQRATLESKVAQLGQQVAQLMQSPQRQPPMLHSGGLYGSTPATIHASGGQARSAAGANPALARADDRHAGGLVAPIFGNSDANDRMLLTPAPAALLPPPASTAQAGGGSPAAPLALAGGGTPAPAAPAATPATTASASAPTPSAREPWTSLSLTSSESDAATTPASTPAPTAPPASAPASAPAAATPSKVKSDKGKTVPELMGEALAQEQKEKRELQATIKKLKERQLQIPTWIREAAYQGVVRLHAMLGRYAGSMGKSDLILAGIIAAALIKYIDKGAMRRIAISVVTGIGMIIRDAATSVTPTSVGRIGHAATQTLHALSMLVITLSDAIGKLFRTVVSVLGKPVGNGSGNPQQPPPATPAPTPADSDDGSIPDGATVTYPNGDVITFNQNEP
eukprot:1666885-Prymnesium_polylepis.1